MRFTTRRLFLAIAVIALTIGGFRWMLSDSSRFLFNTGFRVPLGAKVITTGDSHGGFHGDGEFHLVFDTRTSTIDKWLVQPPPWGNPTWLKGPVPGSIGFHAKFGTDGVGAHSVDGINYKYSGDEQLASLLSSPDIWYAARERQSDWHNGDLLIVDPTANRIWYAEWDF
ncbi:MAG: hypothetical protein R3E01_36720 [Pirellulaceae bacterium]